MAYEFVSFASGLVSGSGLGSEQDVGTEHALESSRRKELLLEVLNHLPLALPATLRLLWRLPHSGIWELDPYGSFGGCHTAGFGSWIPMAPLAAATQRDLGVGSLWYSGMGQIHRIGSTRRRPR